MSQRKFAAASAGLLALTLCATCSASGDHAGSVAFGYVRGQVPVSSPEVCKLVPMAAIGQAIGAMPQSATPIDTMKLASPLPDQSGCRWAGPANPLMMLSIDFITAPLGWLKSGNGTDRHTTIAGYPALTFVNEDHEAYCEVALGTNLTMDVRNEMDGGTAACTKIAEIALANLHKLHKLR